jgi:polyribonucleotide nucleotidyltransferase
VVKLFKLLQKEYQVEIYIEEDGSVSIAGTDSALAKKCKEQIKAIVSDPEIGKNYNAKVVKDN